MHLQCASAPQFLDCVPDDHAVRGSSPSSEFFFLLIHNLIFYSTVGGLTKFKTCRSLSDLIV